MCNYVQWDSTSWDKLDVGNFEDCDVLECDQYVWGKTHKSQLNGTTKARRGGFSLSRPAVLSATSQGKVGVFVGHCSGIYI